LNTIAHNKELELSLRSFEAELRQRDKIVESSEKDIHRKTDVIRQRQIHVDRLNKKYDHLCSGSEEDNTAPVEVSAYANSRSKSSPRFRPTSICV
jgi:uncharacterized protein (DUF3084 family)